MQVELKKMPPPDCQLCEDTAATLHCKQCQENFCQECFDALHYSGKRQGHEVTPVQASAQNSPAKLPPPSSSAPIGGVGLFLKPNEKQELEIVRLARGGSAESSGQIQPGDIVFEVDHHDVYKKAFGVFVQHIQGPVGTNVEVKVYKNGDMNNPRAVRLQRTLNPEDTARPPPQRSAPVSGAAADIGVEFEAAENGCFQVTGMKPGGPAQRSGQVDLGDILYEIDGVKVLYGIGPNGRTLHNIEIAEMLRGPDQTVLNLRLQKGKRGRLAQVNLTREPGFPSQPRGAASPQHAPMQMAPQQQQQQQRVSAQRAAAPQPVNNTFMQPMPDIDKPRQLLAAPQFVRSPPQQIWQPPQPPPKPVAPPVPEIDLSPARNYEPTTCPDRFGMGVSFKSYGGQVRVSEILPDGPAAKGGADIKSGDWLVAIFNTRGVPIPVRGNPQPMATMRKMIFERLKLDVIKLRLRRPGQDTDHDAVMHKGGTGVRRENCHVGIVFHQDSNGSGWVRVKQVIPDSPASKLADSTHTLKVNDRILEVNGNDVARKPLETWHGMLVGKENTPCILTLADFYGKVYTCNILRKPVGQLHPLVEKKLDEADRENYINVSKVNPKAIYIAPPQNEKPVHVERPRMVQTKKYICNVFGVTCGLSFVLNEHSEAVVDHVNANGPARGKGILAGDVVHKIGDGPDVNQKKFPLTDVYKKDIPLWAHVITEGQPETEVEFELARPSGEKYKTTVQRELMVPLTDGKEDLFSPGLYLSSEGNKIYVDKNGVVPNSSAAEQGVLELYILESIDNYRVADKPLDEVMSKMNEMLIGPEDSPILMVFKTAAGLMRYNLKRDVPMKMGKCTPAQAEGAKRRNKLGSAFAYEPDTLKPGQGVPLHPMCNPKLWASLKEGAEMADKQYKELQQSGAQADNAEQHFIWRQRMIKRTGDMPGVQVKEDMWRVEEVIGNGPLERHLIYYGPGPADTDKEEEVRKQELLVKAERAQKAAAAAAAKRVEDEEKKRKQREAEAAKKAAQQPAAKPDQSSSYQPSAQEDQNFDNKVFLNASTPATRAAPPPAVPSPPGQKPPASAAEAEEDDESLLQLNDKSTVPAANLEKILKRHLDAVEHVMVVGSGKEFLSCMLTLKTKGSEAAARGEDPAALGPAKDELAADSLALAQAFGSEATTVLKARTCSKFRGEGLLPLFAKANAEIKLSSQQVRRFSILTRIFSVKTNEMLPSGQLNRLAIKKQNKNIIDGMYQQKKAAPPKA